MHDIPIYKAEAEIKGLADKIKANRSFSYCSPLQPMLSTERESIYAALKARQGGEQRIKAFLQGDLYPTKSLLASTVWNLNDDIFDREETWAARHTPINKPTNLEHLEDQIVGHMTDSWVIDEAGKLLEDDTIVGDLPELFHLCNGAVIYTHWEDDARSKRTEELIQQIEAGEKFVSMEALFAKFDYGVLKGDDFHIIARNEESAFLTKHLRAYGGRGTYEGYQLGRLMRGFCFSGKGYVDKPANPDSVIFTNAHAFNTSAASHENPFRKVAGVYISYRQLVAANANQEQKGIKMSNELEILKSQLTEVKDNLKASNEQNSELKKQMAEAGIEKYKATIIELTEKLEEATKASAEEKDAKDAETAKASELKTEVEELTKANTELTEEVSKVEAEKVRAGRISTLVDGGIAKEDAEAKVATFTNLDEEQFGVLASELVEAEKARKSVASTEETPEEPTEEATASEEETDEAVENADEETLETAEASEEADASAAGESTKTDELKSTRAGLSKWMHQRLGKSTSDESEGSDEE